MKMIIPFPIIDEEPPPPAASQSLPQGEKENDLLIVFPVEEAAEEAA